jgi:DNA-binding transcriptional MerR regulator
LTRAKPWASVRFGPVSEHLTLKDMIRGSGCTPRTVRYYERQGLLRARRSPGGHRLFPRSELERLNFIISLREAGWALDEVTSFLAARDAADDDRAACAGLEVQLADQVRRLERKIAVLQRLRDDLAGTAELLPVCHECTETRPAVECHSCERVPALDALPRSFRLIWRASELDAADSPFDEARADGHDDEPADVPTPSETQSR